MALLTKKQFEQLAKEKNKYCISIYIQTHRSGENKDSLIKLKNQISKVETDLSDLGVNVNKIKKYLEPLNDLINDSNFWRHLSDALIIFRTADSFLYKTLPLEISEISVVAEQYYLLPLLSIFNNKHSFFILTLSMNKNRLYEATQNEIAEIITDGILPDKMGNFIRVDDKKTEIIKYLTDLDTGLNDILEGYRSPLIVASVDNIFSLYQNISKYQNLFKEFISGNYDDEDILLVHEKSCKLLEPYFNKARNNQKATYSENVNKTTSDIDEIVKTAFAGDIDTLFVNKYKQVWGNFKQETSSVIINLNKNPLDICLLDLAARFTFLKGGKVFLEEPLNLPEPNTLANAILRY